MPMYEASLSYGCQFDPEKVLKRYTKKVKAVFEKHPRYDSESGKRIEDEEVEIESAKLVVTILGKKFEHEVDVDDLDDLADVDLTDLYDEVFEFVAKKLGCEYGRGSPTCGESGECDRDSVEHCFQVKGDNRDIKWVVKTAYPYLLKLQQKLKKLGIKVNNPRIFLRASEF